jgi:hypothetical protein
VTFMRRWKDNFKLGLRKIGFEDIVAYRHVARR